MEKTHEQWDDIANLINKEKEKALEDFRRLRFEPGARPDQKTRPVFSPRLVWRPMFTAVAASLFLIAGLILFWTLNGSWHSVSTAPAVERLLADSFLYSRAGTSDRETSALPPLPASNPFFTAWAEAGLMTAVVDVPVDPSAPVEHGDPDEVRRRIVQAITEGTFEQLLLTMRTILNKEA